MRESVEAMLNAVAASDFSWGTFLFFYEGHKRLLRKRKLVLSRDLPNPERLSANSLNVSTEHWTGRLSNLFVPLL